ncbi:Lsr2 family protein [Streptomyces sp. NBC_01571]|uniref:Lsr2 family DNA-binding protein n=1 Tax=Streptomyces sp. NBC_01571 TaxID=2975883 RepID=UPI00225093EA|nr:histone-like nucleoid-structuring protein Lsr2 [Streptomyces sp. NBC_01571]MCX4577953.1 Lsr2 family protein [Streptomyces sp. NBC_01571]
MATNAVPVTADQKDEPGVQKVATFIPGVGNVDAYFKVETTDDLDSKTTEDVQTLRLTVPQEAEQEVTVLDAEGDPVLNEDGSEKLTTEKVWNYVALELDLGQASRTKLLKALEPFVKAGRPANAPAVHAPAAAKSSSGHDLNAIRAWARDAGHDVKDKGRIAANILTAYYKATGKSNPDA